MFLLMILKSDNFPKERSIGFQDTSQTLFFKPQGSLGASLESQGRALWVFGGTPGTIVMFCFGIVYTIAAMVCTIANKVFALSGLRGS